MEKEKVIEKMRQLNERMAQVRAAKQGGQIKASILHKDKMIAMLKEKISRMQSVNIEKNRSSYDK